MARRLSPQIRNDPTRTLRLIEKNERAATRLVRAYYADVAGAVREGARMHAGVELDILDGTLRRTDDLARLLGEDLAKLAESGTWDGYAAGHRFGSVALGAEIGERQEAWRKIGVLVESHQGEFAGMTADMSKDVRRVISDGMLNERSQGQMIAEIMARSDASAQRAETIVRTEVMRATNAGVTDRYVEAGVDVVEWVTCGDSRACGRCMDLDGRRFPIGDAPPRPLHPRCRCTVVPVIAVPGKDAPKTESWEDMQRGVTEPRVITGRQALKDLEATVSDLDSEFAAIVREYDDKVARYADETKVLYKMQDDIMATPEGPDRDRLAEKFVAYRKEHHEGLGVQIRDLSRRRQEFQDYARKRVHERVLFEADPPATMNYIKQKGATIRSGTAYQVDDAFEWLRKVMKVDGLPDAQLMTLPRGGRAFYDSATGVIHVPVSTDARTVIHEYGHHIEFKGRAAMEESLRFYRARTKGEPLRRLTDITGSVGYRSDEVTRVDKFIDPYMGKFYGRGESMAATELVSMGIEMLYSDPVKLARQDPEYFVWIVNVVKGRGQA
ncbi:MAG: minor capsid protein [Caldisericia bacterium]|nr:minor capsid protein [Candidatus Nanoarchaeia archaeon]MDD4613811.1 minor capsid protein [Caldisericia bacterium]